MSEELLAVKLELNDEGGSIFGICQCCLGQAECLSMVVCYSRAGEEEKFAEMLMDTFSINVEECTSDSNPLICTECVSRLRDARAFRAQVQSAQSQLREQQDFECTQMLKLEFQDEVESGEKLTPDVSQGDNIFEACGLTHVQVKAATSEFPLHFTIAKTHITNKLHMCDICDKNFKDDPSLEKHVDECHNFIKINAGSEGFENNSLLEIGSLENNGLVCKYCSTEFNRKDHLKNHLRMHTGEKPYICEYCNASFSRQDMLKRHLRSHTGEKPYMCKYCSVCFKQKYHLKMHLRIHTGEKPFSCTECNAAFSRNDILTRHIRSHTGEKPFACNYCTAAYSKKYHLKNHLTKHHGEHALIC